MTRLRRVVFLQFLGAAVLAGGLLWLARTRAALDYIAGIQQHIAAMGWLAGVLYPLLFGFCNVLLLPGGALAVSSGLFFGLWWGSFLNLAGSLFGAAIAFGIGRALGRKRIPSRVLEDPRWAALDRAIGREGWKIIFLTQLHPLAPTSLLNYLYGVTRVPFRTCMLWIALGQAPGLFLYAYLGTLAQLGVRLFRGQTHPHAREYFVWIGGLVLTAIVTILLGRIALRLLAEAGAAAKLPADGEPKSQGNPASPTAVRSEMPVAKPIAAEGAALSTR